MGALHALTLGTRVLKRNKKSYQGHFEYSQTFGSKITSVYLSNPLIVQY